jgi:hypothetical protein
MPIFGNPERLLDFSNALLIVAAALTVVATFAIVYFGNKVTSIKQSQLKAYQTAADERIAIANKSAAQANSDAATANNLAAQAKVTAGTANLKAEEAHVTAERAHLETAKIQQGNLLLQAQLEKERDARVAIEKRLAPRGLNMGEIGSIRRAVYPLGLQPIDIVYYANDPEIRGLANNLAITFEAWEVTLYEAPMGYSRGITIEYDPKDAKATERSQAMFDALRGHEFRINGPFASLPSPIEATNANYFKVPPIATIRITVGYK